MLPGRIEIRLGAQTLILESGKLAKQANGAVVVTCGGTVCLVTACMSNHPVEGKDYFPLMVEYQEKTYSAGRIPGGFFKREGRPTEKEILTSRVIDRPIRPLFPKGFFHDVQVVASVLSSDGENDPDILAIVGASAALTISDIPFDGPLGAVRVGLIDNQLVLNPTYIQRDQSVLDLIVVGHKDGIVMLEGESKEIPESKLLEAIAFAQEALQPIAAVQQELRQQCGKKKEEVKIFEIQPELINKIKDLSKDRIATIYKIGDKEKREQARDELIDELTKDMTQFDTYKFNDREVTRNDLLLLLEEIEYEEVRRLIFKENRRADGRGAKDLRSISCEVNVLPRTHGSGLFTRGQTQGLAVVTLGSRHDEQMVEALDGTSYKTFMLHYNFPSFSVGETRPMRGPGRREIGHGALAGKALKAVLPTKEEFPYTIRVVSEILESNGSSSMATVCAGSLSLMDAGVPIKSTVAGISIGLVSEGDQFVLLTDIMGLEDHFGEMDFKIAGTGQGITAIQLDLKRQGVSQALLSQAVEQAQEARLKILGQMLQEIAHPREELSPYAPRIITLQINPEKIGDIIGPGGKMIKKIIEQTGVTSIDIEDDGRVYIASVKKEGAQQAQDYINGLVEEPEVGKIYNGRVTRIMDFGAFCEFLPGQEGLVHISELANTYVKDINSQVKVGDQFKVKVIAIDELNRVNLSKKQAEGDFAGQPVTVKNKEGNRKPYR